MMRANTTVIERLFRPAPDRRLGERLVQEGHITEQQLRQALEVQGRTHGLLGQILVDLGFVSAPTVGRLMAKNFGVEYVDLMEVRPDPSAV
ncbi:MAG TPA: hypothetical protein PLU39_19190, partial [Armatimonadota bacterium]|nr:hypothetical protein [Armatimonadota bacterium]